MCRKSDADAIVGLPAVIAFGPMDASLDSVRFASILGDIYTVIKYR